MTKSIQNKKSCIPKEMAPAALPPWLTVLYPNMVLMDMKSENSRK